MQHLSQCPSSGPRNGLTRNRGRRLLCRANGLAVVAVLAPERRRFSNWRSENLWRPRHKLDRPKVTLKELRLETQFGRLCHHDRDLSVYLAALWNIVLLLFSPPNLTETVVHCCVSVCGNGIRWKIPPPQETVELISSLAILFPPQLH